MPVFLFVLNAGAILVLAMVALFIETTRLIVGAQFMKHFDLGKLNDEKEEVKKKLSEIKSEQLEFVQKSKLERSHIKVDKQIETMKSELLGSSKKYKYYFRIARVRNVNLILLLFLLFLLHVFYLILLFNSSEFLFYFVGSLFCAPFSRP